jgi:ribosome-binding protein aMBF1 (putative translation factor)
MTPLQCVTARARLGWGVRRLAAEAEVAPSTAHRFEVGRHTPTRATLAAMQRALEAAGVEFRPDGSVQLREPAEPAQ